MNFKYVRQHIYSVILNSIVRNMRKHRFTLLFFIISLSPASAQFDTLWVKRNIQQCADSLTHGFKIKDWELYARYSYPAMIGSMGGKEEFKKMIAGTFAHVPESAWEKYEPGKILQVLKTAGDMQAVIELKSVLLFEGNRITTISHLIGESWDGGQFWTFFGTEGDREMARLIKPDLDEHLVIPPKRETREPAGQ
jgi:hypothetical protein